MSAKERACLEVGLRYSTNVTIWPQSLAELIINSTPHPRSPDNSSQSTAIVRHLGGRHRLDVGLGEGASLDERLVETRRVPGGHLLRRGGYARGQRPSARLGVDEDRYPVCR